MALTLAQAKKWLTDNGIEFSANETLPELRDLCTENGYTAEKTPAQLFQAKRAKYREDYPSTYERWLSPFSNATFVKEEPCEGKKSTYLRCELKSATGVHYMGFSSLDKAAGDRDVSTLLFSATATEKDGKTVMTYTAHTA